MTDPPPPASVRGGVDHLDMWAVDVCCSDCDAELEVIVEDLEDVEAVTCECGHCVAVLSVAAHVPLLAPA